jgi:hypothetical protein
MTMVAADFCRRCPAVPAGGRLRRPEGAFAAVAGLPGQYGGLGGRGARGGRCRERGLTEPVREDACRAGSEMRREVGGEQAGDLLGPETLGEPLGYARCQLGDLAAGEDQSAVDDAQGGEDGDGWGSAS